MNTINTPKNRKGFALIELMIVVAVIAVLMAIVIPSYVGMKNKAMKGVIQRAASAAESDILGWLQSARKGGSTLREIDTNGNGVAGDVNDLTNYNLAIDLATPNQLCQRYINARFFTVEEYSPWEPALRLWTTAISSGATANARIACNQEADATTILLEGRDRLGSSIYRKEISID